MSSTGSVFVQFLLLLSCLSNFPTSDFDQNWSQRQVHEPSHTQTMTRSKVKTDSQLVKDVIFLLRFLFFFFYDNSERSTSH